MADQDDKQKSLTQIMAERADPDKRKAFADAFNKRTGNDDASPGGQSPGMMDAIKRRLQGV